MILAREFKIPITPKVLLRFEEKYIPVTESGCWLWINSIKDEYGQFYINSVCKVAAHRVSYQLYKGAIPQGFVIDHLCRVKSCVNPAHLEAVTSAENTRRGMWPIRSHVRKTHCKRGHEFTIANLFFYQDGQRKDKRECKTCRLINRHHRKTSATPEPRADVFGKVR